MHSTSGAVSARSQSNLDVMRGWIDAQNRQDQDGALAFLDVGVEVEDVPTGVKYKGLDAMKEMAGVAHGVQGIKEITNLFANEDWACVEYVAKARLSGEVDVSGPAVMADGKKEVELKVCCLAHFNKDGKIDHARGYYDLLSVKTRLGVGQAGVDGPSEQDLEAEGHTQQAATKASNSRGTYPRCIEELRKRFGDLTVKESLEGFSQTLQISLTDLSEDYVFTIRNGKLAKVEKRNLPDAGIVVTVTSSVFEGIMDKTSNPMMAYLKGKFKMKGERDDLKRLQKLMG